MAFWQNVMADRVVGSAASTSPGSGWTSVADFPTLASNAAGLNLPLILLPGTYQSAQVNVTSNPLILIGAIKGGATIQFTGGTNLFNINAPNCKIQDVNVNGNNVAFTSPTQLSALINVNGNQFVTCVISGCQIYNSTLSGITCSVSATATITGNLIYSCNTGIWSIDSIVFVDGNTIQYCNNNGVLVWATNEGNVGSSVVSRNIITNISNTSGGSGMYGNGVNVFKAGGTKVIDNTIYTCSYTSIRINIASNCQVTGNHCVGAAGDSAIYFEAPGPGGGGTTLIGGIFANNTVDTSTSGVRGLSVVNQGLYSDGITRRITVSGNQINVIAAIGIIAEGGVDVIGNTIDTTSASASIGIVLGTNNAAQDLLASGNYVHACALGIGYSANGAAANILIGGNLISGYTANNVPGSSGYATSGAIVSVSYGGTTYTRDYTGSTPNIDYGNTSQIVVGSLTAGMNRAR